MGNINLKKIVDIPVLENLDENTHLLVEHNGEYKRAPKDKVGGGSALDVCLVHIDAGMNLTYMELVSAATCNKTYREIKEAALNKKPIIVTLSVTNYEYPEDGGDGAEQVCVGVCECHVSWVVLVGEDHLHIIFEGMGEGFKLHSDNTITYSVGA